MLVMFSFAAFTCYLLVITVDTSFVSFLSSTYEALTSSVMELEITSILLPCFGLCSMVMLVFSLASCGRPA